MGCALNYLFRPRPEVLDLVRDNYEVLRDPAALKIGIQVGATVPAGRKSPDAVMVALQPAPTW